MSPMNITSLDKMQATDISSVSDESSLGAWNEGSGKFAEIINQHKQNASGKVNPKSGNVTNEPVSQGVKDTPSADENHDQVDMIAGTESQANDSQASEPASQSSSSSSESKAIADDKTSESNVLIQEKITQEDQAEHLKLLAMLKASDEVSTEHTTTEGKAREDEKFAKLLSELPKAAEKDVAQLKEKFANGKGEIASIKVQSFDSPIIYQSKSSEETNTTLAGQVVDAEASTDEVSQDETAVMNAVKNKDSFVSQTTALVDKNQPKLENEKLSPLASSTLIDEETKGENIDDDQETLLTKKLASDQINNPSIEKNADNNKVKNVSEQSLSTVESSLKNNVPQSIVLNQSIASDESVEASKEITGVSHKGVVKDNNALSERMNLAQQLGDSDTNNIKQTSSEKREGQGNSSSQNQMPMGSNEQLTTEVEEEKLEPEHSELDFAITEHKLASVSGTVKESLLVKPAEVNSPTNIHSTSFLRAEELAASDVIEKTASDSIDAMTQKKTLNIHNETIAIYRKDFSVAVKEKVMVMINQKLQQIEIRLDPPELGSLHVKVNLQHDQAVVSFIVQNQQAKEALDQNMGKLRDMLSQNGVDVGDTNVEQQQQQASGENGDTSQGRHFNGGTSSELEGEQTFTANANLYKASATGVDYYA
ncbi:flagellar hook-length control protein FliK [Thalassotalea piscium]